MGGRPAALIRRLTYNLSSDMDPYVMPDGRILLASWQRANFKRGLRGRISLFGVNTDGADYAAFCNPEQGKRIKCMPCTTTAGLAVFVESDRLPWDGAGTLGAVRLRRPLHDYRALTQAQDGLFHSPFGLPDGSLLVSRRSVNGDDTHGLYQMDPSSGDLELLYDDAAYHEIQARPIIQRPEPDGRSSVVTEDDPNGKLYCLNVNLADVNMPVGQARRLRVLEGIPTAAHETIDPRAPRLAQRRILGEIDLCSDGSFNIEIPASIPIELQTLDADGMALRTCGWIWAKNHEPRGCIGCHEDGELTPENTLVEAVQRSSIQLTLPPKQRRTVDFRHDVMPIITDKCLQCHQSSDAGVRLTGDFTQGGLAFPDDTAQRGVVALRDVETGDRVLSRNKASMSIQASPGPVR